VERCHFLRAALLNPDDFRWSGWWGDHAVNEAEARAILGIAPTATLEEAKKAHRSLVKVFHPDLAGPNKEAVQQATEATARINEAWTTLQELAARGLLGRFVDEPAGSEPRGATFRIRRRAPHSGECMICGSYPAIQANLKFVQTFLVWAQGGTVSGALCRACGLEMFRDAQTRNLTRGWWGIGIVFMVVYLFTNLGARRRIVNQPPPAYRDFSVVSPTDMPLLPGRPVFKRPSVVVVTGFVAVVVASFVWASSTASPTPRPSTASTTSAPAETPPTADMAYGVDDFKRQMAAVVDSQTEVSEGRRSCLKIQIRTLSDSDAEGLMREFEAQFYRGPVWSAIQSACQGPFEGDCFIEEGGQLRPVQCGELGVDWRLVTSVPLYADCPDGLVSFVAPANPSTLCMVPQ
jgi:hypothetical protein